MKTMMLGALHWHSLGRTYEHPYEVFNAQYMVLDACWAIHAKLARLPPNTGTHTTRVERLAAKYGVQLPEWAVIHGKESYLSQLRNDLVHEALWEKEPIGLSHPKEYASIHTDLYRLNSRLIIALLGDESEYIHFPIAAEPTVLD